MDLLTVFTVVENNDPFITISVIRYDHTTQYDSRV